MDPEHTYLTGTQSVAVPRDGTSGVAKASQRRNGGSALRGTRSAARIARFADSIGFISVGLGAFGLIAPGSVARTLGLSDGARARSTIRTAALGQLVAGLGVLTQRQTSPWLWTRVASDALGVALIAGARRAGALPASSALLTGSGLATFALVAAATSLREAQVSPAGNPRGVYVNVSITIQRSTHEVYHAWRDLQSLPRFMSHVESVKLEGGTVRFRARLPGGLPLEWEVQLTDDVPGSRISWESLTNSMLRNHGTVTFVPAPGNLGTELHVVLHYEPPAGALGHTFMRLFGLLPREKMRADLRRFKQILETGSVMHSDASVHDGPHPARPSLLQRAQGEPIVGWGRRMCA